ncbi:unnamed protein product [Toxocara canis]|uniref:G_PROTEIN_RECEP_F1_2 domain-containing protein n=1 Tax=Toxocara canis TaxID=6265 RepID=A0A183UAP1_TOXCA|nr:unnamed protein product [Toxocara canis]
MNCVIRHARSSDLKLFIQACGLAVLQLSPSNWEDESVVDVSPSVGRLSGESLPSYLLGVPLSANNRTLQGGDGEQWKAPTTEPLLAMAVCAFFGAIVPLPFTLWYYTLDHKNDLNQNIELCYVHKLCMELIPFFFNTLITLFTLILGGQRFIAVHYPLRCARWCTKRMTRRVSYGALLFALAWTSIQSAAEFRVIYHFCIQISEDGSGVWAARCFLGHSQLVKWIGTELFVVVYDTSRIVVLKLIPCVVLFLLTIQLIRAIKSADSIEISSNGDLLRTHRHRRASSKGSSSTKTTVMLTVIIVMFLVAQLPSVIITGCLKLSDLRPFSAFSICENPHLYAIANIIIIGVHPITFAIYMLMSRRFRRTLRRLLAFRVVAKAENALFWSSTRGNLSQCPVSLNGVSERVREVTLLRR